MVPYEYNITYPVATVALQNNTVNGRASNKSEVYLIISPLVGIKRLRLLPP